MKLAVPALILALLLAATASAATKRIEDGKRETTALAENGRVDIIRASSARFGKDLRYAITMRKRVRPKGQREQPQLLLNTRGDGKSDPEFVLLGDDLFDVRGDRSKRIGPAQLGAKGTDVVVPLRPDRDPGRPRPLRLGRDHRRRPSPRRRPERPLRQGAGVGGVRPLSIAPGRETA